jgi:polar amino acid transport system substrate-binding protein
LPATQRFVRLRAMQLHGLVLAIALIGAVAPRVHADTPPPASGKRTFVVGTRPVPPFIIKKGNDWSGISIELVRRIAEEMNADLDIRELPLDELVGGKNPAVDITASLNVTERSDAAFDLSHAFYSTGLAVAIPERGKESKWEVVERMFSGTFMWLLGGTLVLLTAVGFLMWWVEKRPVRELPKERQQLSKSLFWAFEPVIGYKSSQHMTRAGRIIGTVWGLFGLVFISSLTANLSSQLTVHQLASPIKGPEDLVRKRVGTVKSSAGLKFCERRGLKRTVYDDADAALAALERDDVDAVIYEAPVMSYLAETSHRGVRVLPGTFANHGYAFGLRIDSPIRREFNRALVKTTASDGWTTILSSYLGGADN